MPLNKCLPPVLTEGVVLWLNGVGTDELKSELDELAGIAL